MSPEQEFCNDPLAFVGKHVVIADIVPGKPGTNVVQIGVEDMTSQNWTVANGTGSEKVFRLIARPDRYTPSIPSYICPYQVDEANAINLGNDAMWMFTALMDGCTFGVGSQGRGSGGCVRVAHVNAANATQYQPKDVGREAQAKLQRNLAKTKIGPKGTLIEPSDYRLMADGADVMLATTFGTHALGAAWNFYTQTYTWIGPKQTFSQQPRRYLYGALTQRV